MIPSPVTPISSTIPAGKRPPPAHRRMLDRRDQKPRASAGMSSALLVCRSQGQHVGLGRTRGEDDVARRGTDQRRHLLPCELDQAARGPALAMDRGGIAELVERRHHRGARLRAQRRRRVPVEVGPSVHDPFNVRSTPHASFADIAARRLHEVLAFYLPDRAREHPPREPDCPQLERRPGAVRQNRMVLKSYARSPSTSSASARAVEGPSDG